MLLLTDIVKSAVLRFLKAISKISHVFPILKTHFFLFGKSYNIYEVQYYNNNFDRFPVILCGVRRCRRRYLRNITFIEENNIVV